MVMPRQKPDSGESTSPVSVRTASAADVPAIISLANAAFAIETFLEGARTDQERMAEMMQSGALLLAEDAQGTILASVYIELRGDRGYFGMLAVDPARQGSGLGRLMTAAAEDYCRQRGCKHMDLTVLTLRPELPGLYRKLGYAETRREPFLPPRKLKPGAECECIVMSKAL
jgi:ribosomal protein S18 acetylase RimI-like enzyme